MTSDFLSKIAQKRLIFEYKFSLEMLYSYMLTEMQNLTANVPGLLAEIEGLKTEIKTYKEQIAWCKKQLFGPKSERFVDTPGENIELPGFDDLFAETSAEAAQKEHIEYTRNKSKKRNKGTCTLELPDDIHIEEITKDIPEDQLFHPRTEEELVEIGREVVNKLACKPGIFYIKRFVYVKYAVPNNPLAGVIQKPADDSVLTGSKFDESFMAYVISEKLAYHTPFYRQQERLSFNGIKVERQTLCSLVKNIGNKMMPLYDEMKRAVFEQGYIFTDDTPVNMLVPGNGKTKETRMWVYEGANPNAPSYKVYEFTENRRYEYPKKFLRGFKGVIHGDAYGAYVDIDGDKHVPIRWASCWVHARRKFIDALAGDQELKKTILRKIRRLFRYERLVWKHSSEIRLAIRAEREKLVVDEIYDILKEKIRTSIMPPKEKLTIAVNYLLRYEANFRLYLSDPNIKLDNNSAERCMRKVVPGKKNWMFIGSPTAGKSMGVLYSFVQTCRSMKIDPQKYLEDIFRRLQGHPHKNLRELLPDQWQQEQAKSKV